MFSSTREAIHAAPDLQHRFFEETIDRPELPLTVVSTLARPFRSGAATVAAR